jgi:hypothetical protein
MTVLHILSGGAAQGLVASLAAKFKALTGLDIEGEFGAVGAMADKLRSGTPADVVVLTAAMIAALAQEKLVVRASISDIGLVETAIAVRGRPDGVGRHCRSHARRFSPPTRSCSGYHGPRPAFMLRKFCNNLISRTRWQPASGSFRMARPPCAIWLKPTPQADPAAPNRPKSSAPRA